MKEKTISDLIFLAEIGSSMIINAGNYSVSEIIILCEHLKGETILKNASKKFKSDKSIFKK